MKFSAASRGTVHTRWALTEIPRLVVAFLAVNLCWTLITVSQQDPTDSQPIFSL